MGFQDIFHSRPVKALALAMGLGLSVPSSQPAQISYVEFNEYERIRKTEFVGLDSEGTYHMPSIIVNAPVGHGYNILVEKGDTLWDISKELSQKEGRRISWQELYNANKEVIGNNPDLIFPYQELKLTTELQTESSGI